MRPVNPRYDRGTRIAVLSIAIALYVAAFPLLDRVNGWEAVLLAALPAAIVGWCWGLVPGVVAGLMSLPVNHGLHTTLGRPLAWTAAYLPSRALPMVGGAAVGGIAAYMASAYSHVRGKLEAQMLVEEALHQREADLREHAAQLSHLAAVTETFNQPLTEAGALEAIGRGAQILLPFARVAIWVRPAGDGAPRCAWLHGLAVCYVDAVLASIEAMPEGRALAGGTPVLVDDTMALPPDAPLRLLATEKRLRAVAVWPLISEGQPLGALAMYLDAPRAWSAMDRHVWAALSRQAASTLASARLRDIETQRSVEMETLLGLAERLRGALRADEINRILAVAAKEALRADHTTITAMGEARTTARLVYAAGLRGEMPDLQWPIKGSLQERILASDAPFVANDPTRERLAVHLVPAEELGPVVIVPMRADHLVMGTLGVARPRGAPPFGDADVRLLRGLAEMGSHALLRAQLIEELEEHTLQAAVALARTIDVRDSPTAGHSERIADMAVATGKALGCDEQTCQDLFWAGLLHDIGKLALPDAVLRKPGPLDNDEWDLVRRHTIIGQDILAPLGRLTTVALIVRAHHERWDGRVSGRAGRRGHPSAGAHSGRRGHLCRDDRGPPLSAGAVPRRGHC